MLLHAAGDQHAWAAVVGSGSPPGYDPFFPIGNGEALAAEIPDARLARLGRTGHRLPARAIPIVA